MSSPKRIENLAWVLPRPSLSHYKGGMPRFAEIKILREIDSDPKVNSEIKILHPFGGRAEFGFRCDVNADADPDLRCDAHLLPFRDCTFDVVFLDPPYNEQYSKALYAAGKPRFKKYTAESVRVLKPEGYMVMYHYMATPRIDGTRLVKRIFIETRLWHKLRVVHIHRKEKA